MSKIFQALKLAESDVAKRPDSGTAATNFRQRFERRKTRRVSISVPLFIYGHTIKDEPFYENARTIAVNGEGALISMQTVVQPGQRLVVTNKMNQRTQIFTILAVAARLGRSQEVALEFVAPTPQFWREPNRKPVGRKSS